VPFLGKETTTLLFVDSKYDLQSGIVNSYSNWLIFIFHLRFYFMHAQAVASLRPISSKDMLFWRQWQARMLGSTLYFVSRIFYWLPSTSLTLYLVWTSRCRC